MATLKNTVINDTGHVTQASGTTGQRPASPVVGMLRYNSTLGFLEQYTPDGWQGIASPPVITSISPTVFNGESGTSITVNGANFDTTATVQFLLTGGTTVNAATTTRVSSSQLTATTSRDFLASESPASVKVNNGSGLAATAENALTFADVPIFTTSAGTLGTIFDVTRSSYSLSSAAATDANGGSITYSITSGAVPTGMSFNTSTAAITGTPNAVGSDTTSSFTIRATDNAGNTADRSFSITVKAPVITSFTSVGSTTFSVPSGLTVVDVLVVGGGGGGTQQHGGAGGAGGLIFRPAAPVSPGGSVPVVVGGGGAGVGNTDNGNGGGDSSFGGLVAKGGGGGGRGWGGGGAAGNPGGSGGGAGAGPGTGNGPGGAATQPSQPGDSGTYGFGNRGGNLNGNSPIPGAGGGGAGQAGADGGGGPGTKGGDGRTYNISGSSVTYAGGGGGGGHTLPYNAGGAAGAGGGGAGGAHPGGTGDNGTANTGGGGGGGGNPINTPFAGSGGSGIVIVKF
jgi:hypothetical protein